MLLFYAVGLESTPELLSQENQYELKIHGQLTTGSPEDLVDQMCRGQHACEAKLNRLSASIDEYEGDYMDTEGQRLQAWLWHSYLRAQSISVVTEADEEHQRKLLSEVNAFVMRLPTKRNRSEHPRPWRRIEPMYKIRHQARLTNAHSRSFQALYHQRHMTHTIAPWPCPSTNGGRINTWEQLRQDLEVVFQAPDHDIRLQQEIFNRMQGETDSVDFFIVAMEGLYGRPATNVRLREFVMLGWTQMASFGKRGQGKWERRHDTPQVEDPASQQPQKAILTIRSNAKKDITARKEILTVFVNFLMRAQVSLLKRGASSSDHLKLEPKTGSSSTREFCRRESANRTVNVSVEEVTLAKNRKLGTLVSDIAPVEDEQSARCKLVILADSHGRDLQSIVSERLLTALYIRDAILHAISTSQTRHRDIHHHNTRNAASFTLPPHHLSLYEKKPSYKGALLYNHLPEEFKKNQHNASRSSSQHGYKTDLSTLKKNFLTTSSFFNSLFQSQLSCLTVQRSFLF
ncbi:hypothetical protein J6590_093800 [Homalodisca vitripennis]|nr:hypothetical protein J6590_093800 [Homalodisca vitripennis]